MDSDPGFLIYRRFGYLRNRLLLNQQDKLRGLEKCLDFLDKGDAEVPERRKMLCSRVVDENQEGPHRKELLIDCLEELKIYGQTNCFFLLRH